MDLITHKYRYKVTSLISNIRGGFLMKSTRNQNTRYQLSAFQPGRIFWKSLRLLLPHPLPWNQYAPSFQCASRETDDSKSCQLLVLTLLVGFKVLCIKSFSTKHRRLFFSSIGSTWSSQTCKSTVKRSAGESNNQTPSSNVIFVA